MTFADEIESVANGEPILIVIGGFGWGDITNTEGYGEESHPVVPLDKRGVVLPWSEARPYLDYEYDRGYGAPDCHAITAWTPSLVIWVTQYDGSTGLTTAPRHPIPMVPTMPGG